MQFHKETAIGLAAVGNAVDNAANSGADMVSADLLDGLEFGAYGLVDDELAVPTNKRSCDDEPVESDDMDVQADARAAGKLSFHRLDLTGGGPPQAAMRVHCLLLQHQLALQIPHSSRRQLMRGAVPLPSVRGPHPMKMVGNTILIVSF